ncbi:MAG: hypothetical protein PHY82_11770 [Lentisphaeria bacterium]|nr:hypothetical protein [Lentisphaeria bacterium]
MLAVKAASMIFFSGRFVLFVVKKATFTQVHLTHYFAILQSKVAISDIYLQSVQGNISLLSLFFSQHQGLQQQHGAKSHE